jgi:hypothetical protein
VAGVAGTGAGARSTCTRVPSSVRHPAWIPSGAARTPEPGLEEATEERRLDARPSTLRRMRKSKTLIPATLGALALVPAAAAAHRTGPVAHADRFGDKVVLFKSVAGIGLGITPKAVEHKLGKPSHTIRVSGRIAEFEYRGADQSAIVSVTFDTINPRDLDDGVFGYADTLHTSKGIHPGSSIAAVKRAYQSQGLKHVGGGSYTLYQGTPGAIGYHETDFGSFHGTVVDIGIQTELNDG